MTECGRILQELEMLKKTNDERLARRLSDWYGFVLSELTAGRVGDFIRSVPVDLLGIHRHKLSGVFSDVRLDELSRRNQGFFACEGDSLTFFKRPYEREDPGKPRYRVDYHVGFVQLRAPGDAFGSREDDQVVETEGGLLPLGRPGGFRVFKGNSGGGKLLRLRQHLFPARPRRDGGDLEGRVFPHYVQGLLANGTRGTQHRQVDQRSAPPSCGISPVAHMPFTSRAVSGP